MSKAPFDIKNDPRFKARVKKIEGNQYVRVLKEPIAIRLEEREVLIACIGINDSYLIVEPQLSNAASRLEVYWSKTDGFNRGSALHDQISNKMVNWTMMHSNGESDFIKVRHGNFDIKDLAVRTVAKKLGEGFFENKKDFGMMVQGTYIEAFKNPFHK